MIRLIFVRKVSLEELHFCKNNKVKYRVHLTMGMLGTTLLYIVGAATGHDWMGHAATGMNLLTALMWIWE